MNTNKNINTNFICKKLGVFPINIGSGLFLLISITINNI